MTDATPLASEQITQEDREAAARLYSLHTSRPEPERALAFTTGVMDDHDFVQAFARHRRHEADVSACTAAMLGKPINPDASTVDLVRYWMMSSDHPVNAWERDFAAAIEARLSATPAPSDQDASQAQGEVVAWAYYLATSIGGDGTYSRFDRRISFRKPCVPEGAVRNLTPLYAAPGATAQDGVELFQQRVQPWLMACFGEMIAGDREERNHRFLEEALELVQACGCTASEAHQLVDYVYGRPLGEPHQEVGGVMVTLAALCLANGLNMHADAETELARIWTKVGAIRAKGAAKPKHSPLPEHTPTPTIPAGMVAWRGGDNAPEDWDGGGVVLRNGSTMFPSKVSLAYHANGTNRWNHQRENRNPDWDIIAYTPLAAAPKQAERVEALRALEWLADCDNLILAASKTSDDWEVRRGSGALRGSGPTPLAAILAALNAPTGAVEKGEAK